MLGETDLQFEVTASDGATSRTFRTSIALQPNAGEIEATARLASGDPAPGLPSTAIILGRDWPNQASFSGATYRWTQIAGPEVEIVDPNSWFEQVQPTAFAVADYTFELTIEHNGITVRRQVTQRVTPDPEATRRTIAETFAEVRNTIDFDPSRLQVRSPEAVASTRRGNAWDQAAYLRSELLRADRLGSDATGLRIVTGRVELTEAEVNAWLGTETIGRAAEILDLAQLNATVSGGTIRFDHAWLRVAVPLNDGTTKALDLDPAFKSYLPSEVGRVDTTALTTDRILAANWRTIDYGTIDFDDLQPESAAPSRLLATDDGKVTVVSDNDEIDTGHGHSSGQPWGGVFEGNRSDDNSLRLENGQGVFLDERLAIDGSIRLDVTRLTEGVEVFGRAGSNREYGVRFQNRNKRKSNGEIVLYRRNHEGEIGVLEDGDGNRIRFDLSDVVHDSLHNGQLDWDQIDYKKVVAARAQAAARIEFEIRGLTVTARIWLFDADSNEPLSVVKANGQTTSVIELSYTDTSENNRDNVTSPGQWGVRVDHRVEHTTLDGGAYAPRIDNVRAKLLAFDHGTAADEFLRLARGGDVGTFRRTIEAVSADALLVNGETTISSGITQPRLVSVPELAGDDDVAKVRLEVVRYGAGDPATGTVLDGSVEIDAAELHDGQFGVFHDGGTYSIYKLRDDPATPDYEPHQTLATFPSVSGTTPVRFRVSVVGDGLGGDRWTQESQTFVGGERLTAIVIDFGQLSEASIAGLQSRALDPLIGLTDDGDERRIRSQILSQIGVDYFLQVGRSREAIDAATGRRTVRGNLDVAFVSAPFKSNWGEDDGGSHLQTPTKVAINVPSQEDDSVALGASPSAAALRRRRDILAFSESTIESRVISSATGQAAASAATTLSYQASQADAPQPDGEMPPGVLELVAKNGGYDDLRTSDPLDFAGEAALRARLELTVGDDPYLPGEQAADRVETAIVDYLDAGAVAGGVGTHRVFVSDRPVAQPPDDDRAWSGIAYIQIDDATGEYESIIIGGRGVVLHGGIEVAQGQAGEAGKLSETVETFTGAVTRTDTDFSVTARGIPVTFSRRYDSRLAASEAGKTGADKQIRDFGFGLGWRSTFDSTIRVKDGEYAIVREADGTETRFEWREAETDEFGGEAAVFVGPSERPDLRLRRLIESETDGAGQEFGFELLRADGSSLVFTAEAVHNEGAGESDFFLTGLVDRHGNEVEVVRGTRQTITRRGYFSPKPFRIYRVTVDHTHRVQEVWVHAAAGGSTRLLDFHYGTAAAPKGWVTQIDVLAADGSGSVQQSWAYSQRPSGEDDEAFLDRVTGPQTDDGQRAESHYEYYGTDGTVDGTSRPHGRSSTQSTNLLAYAKTPGQHGVAYVFDAGKRITRVVEAVGPHETGDSRGNVSETLYRYDRFAHITWVTGPDGRTTELRHTARGQVAEVVLPDGTRSTTDYDEHNGLPLRTVSATGLVSTFGYDAMRRQNRQVDPTGVVSLTNYEARSFGDDSKRLPDGTIIAVPAGYGRPIRTRRVGPAMGPGESVEYTYTISTSGHETVETRHVDGSVSRQTFDPYGRLLYEQPPLDASELTGAAAYRTSFAYDDAVVGLPTATTFGAGAGAVELGSRTYDRRSGHLSTSDSHETGLIAYRTDAYGRVIEEIYEDDRETLDGGATVTIGRKRQFAYDDEGRLESATSLDGLVTVFAYNDAGWKLSETVWRIADRGDDDSVLSVRRWRYAADGKVIQTQESDGTVRSVLYDDNGRISQIIHPGGAIEAYLYDADGRTAWHRAATGVETEYEYDDAGRVHRQTVGGLVTEQTYDGYGRLETVTDPRGPQTRFEYDAQDRIVRTRIGQERVEALTYDARGAVLSTTIYDVSELATSDALQTRSAPSLDAILADVLANQPHRVRTASTVYDAQGRPIERTDALGTVTTLTYDDAGRKLTETDARGVVTTYGYDAETGVLERIARDDQDGRVLVTTMRHDRGGRVVAQTGPDGATTRTVYDALGRVTATIDPLGNRSTRSYDRFGRVVSQTNAVGDTTAMRYDAAGRVVAEIGVDVEVDGDLVAPTARKAYDAAGRVIASFDPDGNETNFLYDDRGRLVRTIGPLVRTGTSTPYRMVSEREYDPATGDLIAETTGLVLLADAAITAEPDRSNARTVRTIYDIHGRRRFVVGTDPDGDGPLDPPITETAYNGFGEVVATVASTGLRTDFVRDAAGRVVSQTVADPDGSGPGVAATTASTYNAAGDRLTQTDALGHVTRFTYDGFGRLIQTTLPAVRVLTESGPRAVSPTTSRTYDAVGRVTFEIDAAGAVTAFEYDDAGRLIQTTLPDPDGPDGPLKSAILTRTYDAADRVTATEQSARAVGGGIETRTSTTEYDALDRIIRTVGVDPDGAGELRGATKEFGYDDDGDLDSERTLFAILAGDVEVWATTTHEHDAFGRVTRTIGPQGSDGVRPVFETAYNAAGQIVAATDPLGRRTLRLHDSRGQLLVATLPYDARLSGTGESLDTRPIPPNEHPSNPLNGALSVRSTYDRLGRVIQTTDSRDRITSTEYDALGRVVRTVGPDPDTGDSALTGAAYTETEYDLGGRAVAVVTGWIGGESRRITTEYDDLDRVIRTSGVHASDAALDGTTSAPTTRTTYDLAGNVLSRTPAAGATLDRHDPSQPGDPADAARTYTYNVLGQLLEEKLPRNAAGQHAYLRFAYDSWGNRIEEIDPLGHSTHRTFDALGRETHAVGPDPDGGLLSDGTPNVDGAGRGDYRRSDRNGEFGDEHASETYRFYGQHGGVVEIRTKRDAISRVAVNHPDGGPSDLLATYNRNVFVATVYEYDRLGRKIAEHSPPNADGLVATIGWEYDAAGQMTAHVDPLGNRIEFAYDHFGHVVADTDSYGHTRFWDYDAHGRLQRSSLRTGQEISYGYDALDRRTRETWRNAAGVLQRNITTEYNARGEVEATFAADGNGSPVGGRVESAYDRRGRVVTETQRQYGIAGMTGELATLEYAYDAADRLRRTKLTDWADNVSLTTYSFDALGQIIGQTHSGSSGSGVNAVTVTSEFDLAGRMTRLTRIGQERAVLTDYEYDAAGRLDRLIHWYSSVNSVTDPNTPVLPGPGGGRSLAETYFQQDAAGLVVGRLEHSSNQPAYFRHDATGQLIFSDYVGTGADEKYWCDLAGNRTHAVLSVDGSRRNYSPNSTLGTPYRYQDTPSGAAGNRLTRDPNYEYTYDAEGRLATRTARFGTEAGHKSTYTWNADGSLRRVITKDEGGAVLADARYHYDPHDRLVAKTVSRPGHPEATERYVVHGGTDSAQIVAMADAAGTVVDRTLLSGETDRPIAVDPVAAGYDGRVRWQLADHLGSVRLSMADVPLADVKAASPFVEYAAFGGLLDATGIAYTDLAGTRYGYTGQRWDADAGLGGCITTAPADTTRLSDLKGRPLRLDRPGRTVRRRRQPVPLRRQPADKQYRPVRQVPQEAVRGHRQGVQPPDRQAVQ